MIDNLLGGDDDDEPTDSDDAEGLFDEGGGGDLDADADLMGEDDGGLMDADDVSMGGMDDGGTGGGGSTEEVQHRMDELENEVDSLSSDISTVKNENEQISEAIDDVEDNIRKLLEIYEMVTKGVNPFVDETELGDAFSSTGDSADSTMGLFDEDEETDESADDGIDESVANADAEEFFDEDLADEADDDFVSADFDAEAEDEMATFDDDLADSAVEDDDEPTESETTDDGTSFEDLKAEYESDEDVDSEAVDDEPDEPDADGGGPADPRGGQSDGISPGVGSGKPYLDAIPAGYVADVVVMDWLEFLVDEAGVDGAARTIAYYEAIEWLSERAAEQLQTYLLGFGDGVAEDPAPRSTLTVAHHNTSLRFISRIADPSMEMVAFEDRLGVGPDGPSARGVADPSPRWEPAGQSTGRRRRPALESDGGHDHPNERGVRPSDAAEATRRYGRERYPSAGEPSAPVDDEADSRPDETDSRAADETDEQADDAADEQADDAADEQADDAADDPVDDEHA